MRGLVPITWTNRYLLRVMLRRWRGAGALVDRVGVMVGVACVVWRVGRYDTYPYLPFPSLTILSLPLLGILDADAILV